MRKWVPLTNYHTVGEAHPVEAGDDRVQVAKTDDTIHRHVLNSTEHLLDCHCSSKLVHAELVGDGMEAVQGW